MFDKYLFIKLSTCRSSVSLSISASLTPTVRVIWVRVTGCINHLEFLKILYWYHSSRGRLLELPQSFVPGCSCMGRLDDCEYGSLPILSQKAKEGLLSSDFWFLSSDFWFLSSDYWVLTFEFWLPSFNFWLLTSEFWHMKFEFSVLSFDLRLLSLNSSLRNSKDRFLTCNLVPWKSSQT